MAKPHSLVACGLFLALGPGNSGAGSSHAEERDQNISE